jgi:N-acetylmuramate 1-kinase
MPHAAQDPSPWLDHAVSATWPRACAAGIVALRGDASTRRFWRVAIKGARQSPSTAVAIDLGPEDLPLYARELKLLSAPLSEPPYLNVHRFLKSIGSPVPEIYYAKAGERLLLVEDVGDRSLFGEVFSSSPEAAADLYRLAVDELLRIHVEGTRRRDDRCLAFSVNYDERLFRWELGRFVEFGLAAVAAGARAQTIEGELAKLASRLGRCPRVLSHRDYHGGNLFVQQTNGGEIRLRILDFQDALLAPPAQDLAVLLTTRDTPRAITPNIESRLLDYYLAGLARRHVDTLERTQFLESYRLCVLQHALKCIGLFARLDREGKHEYSAYSPYAIAQARKMLAQIREFPNLRDVLGAAS